MKSFLPISFIGKGLYGRTQTKHFLSSWQMQLRSNKSQRIRERMKTLKTKMSRLRMEQETIKIGQKEVREKFEAIQHECEKLQKETEVLAKQSINTQLRLGLMFAILKARENNEVSKAATLTQVLAEVVAKQNNGRI